MWTWMPHSAHLIVGYDCDFHLATEVGGYLVSTVGEYFPDSQVREIIAKSKNVKLEGIGDRRRFDFYKKIGYVEIGLGRPYETLVFESSKSGEKCCLFKMKTSKEVDFRGYNTAGDAYNGHMELGENIGQHGKQ